MTKSVDGETPDLGGLADIRPIVASDPGNRSLWIGLASIGFFGLLIFISLESRRSEVIVPAVRPRASDFSANAAAPPTLYVPPEPTFGERANSLLSPVVEDRARTTILPPIVGPNIARALAAPVYSPQVTPFAPPPISVDANRGGPAVVYDVSRTAPDVASGTSQSAEPTPAIATVQRARSARPTNRITTVPQGTLIPAVLETALDSTQPGQARALVSSDITNLNGDRILVPRGSRLFGEYRGDISPGQNRLQLIWTRLVRPDGARVDLNSPTTDKLGRAGIRGKVNTHFLERLGGALLQTVIDVGGIAASRSISNSAVVVALPSTAQSAVSQLIPTAPKPSIRVNQGMSISVFVARDLDFSTVETGF